MCNHAGAAMRRHGFGGWLAARLALAAGLGLGAAHAAEAPLNDTGQTTCYNASTSTGTVSSGTPDPETAGFNEQDCTRGASAADAVGVMDKVGASSVPGRDYTKIANDGSELAAGASLGTGASDWACTRDNITGLIWEIKTDDSGLRDKDHRYTWYDTDTSINGGTAGTEAGTGCSSTLTNCNTTAYRDAVNAAGLCGATDWRLPTGKELQALVHYGASAAPSIDGSWFPNTVSVSGYYWSGTSYAPNASFAWNVNFNFGSLSANI